MNCEYCKTKIDPEEKEKYLQYGNKLVTAHQECARDYVNKAKMLNESTVERMDDSDRMDAWYQTKICLCKKCKKVGYYMIEGEEAYSLENGVCDKCRIKKLKKKVYVIVAFDGERMIYDKHAHFISHIFKSKKELKKALFGTYEDSLILKQIKVYGDEDMDEEYKEYEDGTDGKSVFNEIKSEGTLKNALKKLETVTLHCATNFKVFHGKEKVIVDMLKFFK